MVENDDQLIDTEGLSLWQLIVARALISGDKQMAQDESGRTMTFSQYRSRCEKAAAGLFARGIGEGSAVSWILPSTFEALVLTGALARLGAVQNPILPLYRHREVSFITQQTNCSVMIVPRSFREFDYEKLAREAVGPDAEVIVVDPDLPAGDVGTLASHEPTPDQVRWIFYSSGTTAEPKGAMHTDLTISAANDGMQAGCRIGPNDRSAVVFPITHIGGLVWLFNTMQTGVELLMVSVFDPATTPRWLSDRGCTCAGAGTAFFQSYLAAQKADHTRRLFPDVRIFNGGGAPKPTNLHGELLQTFGAPLLNGWGLTEAPIITMASVDDPDAKLAATEGRPCPGVDLRVVLNDEELDAGSEGELQARGPQICVGYVDPDLDDAAFTDGWFRTGDLGVIDTEGYVTITGRLKDVIVRKGENISAKEIEDLLHAHPQVAQVAVIGVPDPERGERACAVIVASASEPFTFDAFTEYLRDAGLSPHKIPEQVELVEALPRNPTGKVLKKDLRTRFG